MKTPSPDPVLSICIVSWNVREVLRDCLESIRAAGPEIDYEVLVVDNASGDGSADMVESAFPEVSLIRGRRNLGFAAASNRAIRSARGRYLLLLNPDTLLREGSLEEMVRFLDLHPAAGGAGPRLLNPDGSLQPSIRALPNMTAALGEHTILGNLGLFRRARSAYLRREFDYGRPAIVEQPMGAALFLRREALDRVGLLDEGFFLYFEEVDLCRRLAEAGWPLWYNPAAEIVHRGGESTGRAGGRALYCYFRSQFRYFEKVSGPAASGLFKTAFKPLAVLGMYWSLVISLLSLAGGKLAGRPTARLARKRDRLARKWDFLSRYLINFLML